MNFERWAFSVSVVLSFTILTSGAQAQSPSVLYTWDNTGNASPNVENWVKNFGTNTATIDNSIPGELRLIETGSPGTLIAFSDGGNRIRESALNAGGGLDLTGLDYLEFDLGHNGSGNIYTQFYVQASTGYTYRSLGEVLVTPGMNTYQVPLSGLTPNELVYVRTVGFQAFDHLDVGNVTWTLREVRSAGTPLRQRTLISHDNGTPEGGLQGVIANFNISAIQGNNGGQNQTGFSHNPAGSGSLQWTDLGGSDGAGVSWGNGTAWNGNTFNMRSTDLSNYEEMTIRISATDPNGGGGTIGLNAFFQRNNFMLQAAEGGAGRYLPIDGEFHLLKWSLAGLTQMNVVDVTGINLFAHPQDLIINVDFIRFGVPEPSTFTLLALAMLGCGGIHRSARRR